MSSILQRSLGVLEQLAAFPHGRTLSELAAGVGMPMSAAHRLLHELAECRYVRKDERNGDFRLTMRVASLGLRFLSASGISDAARPSLQCLAALSGELVRLAVVDDEQLVFVMHAQGAGSGLRYDPEMGRPVSLSCSAAGFAWLASKSDEDAERLVLQQGIATAPDRGPRAPADLTSVLAEVRAARERGFAMTLDMFACGMSSMAAVVGQAGKAPFALLIIAGPMTRLTESRMLSLGPALLETAGELGLLGSVSPLLLDRRGDDVASH